MPEHEVRRHGQREIREDDFSLTSQEVCAPAQTSGVKKMLSSIFFTLSDHAARQSGNARRKPARVSPMRLAELWAAARHKALRAKNTVSTVFFTLSVHAALMSGSLRRFRGGENGEGSAELWAVPRPKSSESEKNAIER